MSTIIPAYNAEPFLRDAIDSVLAQSLPTELIVVNDGSTDATGRILESYGPLVKRVDQEQSGLGAARNRGIRASQSEWIAFLDADDIWTPDKLRLQMLALAAQPGLDLAFGHGVEFADPGQIGKWTARTDPFPAFLACSAVIRRTLFDKTGGFREDRRVGEWLDWYSRALHEGAAWVMIEEVVFHRRVHDSNMTRLAPGKRTEYLDVIRDHLRRGRAAE